MVGKGIAEIRKEKGWTQKDLADRTRLSRGYIASIERGVSPGVSAVSIIAEALGVEVCELYRGRGGN